ncbi:MAG: hypothetical protein IKT07_01035, partial [Oscillospiraceae bacterium]|nr:hypothetical protein [Oscillospiraceae bacterium]
CSGLCLIARNGCPDLEIRLGREDGSSIEEVENSFVAEADELQERVGLYCDIEGHVENSVLSPNVVVEEGANVVYSVLMPGTVVKAGATVEYAIIGENSIIEAGAHVGAAPDGTDAWGVATCGPNAHIAEGRVVPPSAMIYAGEEV